MVRREEGATEPRASENGSSHANVSTLVHRSRAAVVMHDALRCAKEAGYVSCAIEP
jgi:hypothetical protein